jgi:ribosome-binding protein aMBF1 (putative translation factor)
MSMSRFLFNPLIPWHEPAKEKQGRAIIEDVPAKTRISDDAVVFGTILRRLREANGLTFVQLGDRLGMNAWHLSTLEKGRNMPSVETLLALAEVYGVEASEMLREVEQTRRSRAANRR